MQEMAIVRMIAAIRDSFVGAEHVYMNGSCYYFAKFLQTVYPEGELYENHDHVYFKLGEKYFDIRGEVRPYGDLSKCRVPTAHGKFDLIKGSC